MWVSVAIPYFTFGDDYKMMKQIGIDVVMLAPTLFGVLAASMSISEEIEGRTAVTLMSKPVNRRQFLIGKFLGILMACLVMSMLLNWTLVDALARACREYDPINNADKAFDAIGAPTDRLKDPMTYQAQRAVVPPFQKVVPGAGGKGAGATAPGQWFGGGAGAHSFFIGPRVRAGDDPGRGGHRPGDPVAVRRQSRLVPAWSSTSSATSRRWWCR